VTNISKTGIVILMVWISFRNPHSEIRNREVGLDFVLQPR